ncbi:MAG: hypothetical protein J6I83_04050 [Firmicutes bacterium]|nr:hypothetical protein [Bacillota bacterium]
MADNRQSDLFRKKALDHISSPENLTDYLRVTNPGIWVVLAGVILLLIGLFVWSMIGDLETRADVKVIVDDHQAQIITLGSDSLKEGMTLSVADKEYTIAHAAEDEYGRSVGETAVELPDGTYDGTVVTETVHPIEFLLKSN